MTEPTPIYVVTRGHYSAYTILGTFLDKEVAQTFCDTHNTSDRYFSEQAEIEDWLDATPTGQDPAGHWTLRVDSDDWTDIEQQWSAVHNPAGRMLVSPIEVEEVHSKNGFYSYGKAKPDTIDLTVQAVDLNRGKKVLYDKIAEIKAREAGLT